MGESKVKKNKIDQYSDQIKKFVDGLKLYQQKKEFVIEKYGSEIIELANNGKLQLNNFENIRPKVKYQAKVCEWQFVNHELTIKTNLKQCIAAGLIINIDEVFSNYLKWIENHLEKNCKEKPQEFRKVSIDDYKKFIEEKRSFKENIPVKKKGLIRTLFGSS